MKRSKNSLIIKTIKLVIFCFLFIAFQSQEVFAQDQQENLLLFSEQFDNSEWTKTNITVGANTQVAPDGTTTAETITVTAGNSNHRLTNTNRFLAVLGPYRHAVYLKQGTHRYVAVGDNGDDVTRSATVDLQTCTITANSGNTGSVATSLANSWCRVETYGQRTNVCGGCKNLTMEVQPVSNNTQGLGVTWNAAGTETVHVWGAQITSMPSVDSYTRSTNRYVFRKQCFMPAHNLAWRTEDLNNSSYWNQTTATITKGQTDVPYPPDFNIQATFKAVASAASSNIFFSNTGYYYQDTGKPLLFTTYLRYGNHQWVRAGLSGAATYGCSFDLLNGVVGTAVGATCSMKSVGAGWYKTNVIVDFGSATGLSKSVRPAYQWYTGAAGVTAHTASVGVETVYIAAPQVQYYYGDFEEYDKYIPNNTDYAVYSQSPVICNSTLADNALSASKIASSAITRAKFANNAIDVDVLAANTITASRIADNSITNAKLANGTISAVNFAADAITASAIAPSAIGSSEIADNGITAADIANNAFTSAAFASGAVTSGAIAADAIGSSQLATTATNEIREDILTRQLQDNYSTGTLGWAIDRIKKFIANKMTFSGSNYTIFKDDETTTYNTGTSTSTERNPD